MSPRTHSAAPSSLKTQAPVFAALGDETRLLLVARLAQGMPCSLSQLTEGSRLTRQAIAKHLRVLAEAGIVQSARSGRESLFKFDPKPLEKMKDQLDLWSEQWDQTLARLKAFVENEDPK
jgi:DNA-binding transcriptional ArsR family regulator